MQQCLNPSQEQDLAKAYLDGGSLEGLATIFGCSPGTVRNTLVKLDVPRRGPGRQAQPVQPTKRCSACTRDLPRSAFFGNGRRTSECCKCTSTKGKARYYGDPAVQAKKVASAKAWQDAHPERARARKRMWQNGWPQELFDAAWQEQQGRCAICSCQMFREGRLPNSVCADHDHQTGRPRKLLCRQCNLQLGVYEKHRDRFEAYLKLFQEAP